MSLLVEVYSGTIKSKPVLTPMHTKDYGKAVFHHFIAGDKAIAKNLLKTGLMKASQKYGFKTKISDDIRLSPIKLDPRTIRMTIAHKKDFGQQDIDEVILALTELGFKKPSHDFHNSGSKNDYTAFTFTV